MVYLHVSEINRLAPTWDCVDVVLVWPNGLPQSENFLLPPIRTEKESAGPSKIAASFVGLRRRNSGKSGSGSSIESPKRCVLLTSRWEERDSSLLIWQLTNCWGIVPSGEFLCALLMIDSITFLIHYPRPHALLMLLEVAWMRNKWFSS